MVRELIPSLRGDLESQNPIHISLALSAIGMEAEVVLERW
jgi:hypothetical protein